MKREQITLNRKLLLQKELVKTDIVIIEMAVSTENVGLHISP